MANGRTSNFEEILTSIYVCKPRASRERLTCECSPSDPVPCGSECLNRQLFYECGSSCPCSARCTNQQFSKRLYAKVEVFQTERKGRGLRSLAFLPA